MKNVIVVLVVVLILGIATLVITRDTDDLESPTNLSTTEHSNSNIDSEAPPAAEASSPERETDDNIRTISFTEAEHGSAEFIDARAKAEAIISAPGMRTSRYSIVDLEFDTLDRLYKTAVDGIDHFDEPIVVSLFDDLPCTISKYRQVGHADVGLLISAKCEEYFGRGSMRITLDPSNNWVSVRLYIASDMYRMVGLDEDYAVVYEYSLASNRTRIEERKAQRQ